MMDGLHVKASEYELKSLDGRKVALWENGEMADDLERFEIKIDIQDSNFCLCVKRINRRVVQTRIIEDITIQTGNVILSGDSLSDVYLKFIKENGNQELVKHVYGLSVKWDKGNMAKVIISMHGFWYDNALELGQTEDDWLKSKI